MTWQPNSWRDRPILQVPEYPNEDKVASVEAKLAAMPPLVFAGEVWSSASAGLPLCLPG